jgi:tetratricopeptide (TPR) repeat protein
MLKLREVGNREWEFVHPEGYNDTFVLFDAGCDLFENGHYEKAEENFRKVIEEMPDHLDAIHHAALMCDLTGRTEEAVVLWEKAVAMGWKAFPPEFTVGKDILLWGFHENRSFLRCLHGLGYAYRNTGKVILANHIFVEILKLNPGDNQGARALAVNTYLALDEPYKALEICEKYPDDCLVDILYGRVLAYYCIENMDRAGESLSQAIDMRPKVVRAIIAKTMRKPKNISYGYITAGGDDEAYAYRTENRNLWKRTKGAIEWLETRLKEKSTHRNVGRFPEEETRRGLNGMTKKMKKELSELARTAYRREMTAALKDLYSEFEKWRKNEIDEIEMNGLVHKFHNGVSRDLWSRYVGSLANNELLVVRALAVRILTEQEVSEELMDRLSLKLRNYKEMLYGEFIDDEEAEKIARAMSREFPELENADGKFKLQTKDLIRFGPVSKRCKLERENKNLSVKDVSRDLGIPQYRIKDIESSGVGRIYPDFLNRYAEYLEIAEWFNAWKERNMDVYSRLLLKEH